nr:reverse transcriptase domain-containing protein [Tanacetum cinerariifolium]
MTDNHTMAEMLREPTEGCAEAIVVPPILAEQFELKHSLINMMNSEQFFRLEKDNPHDHVRWGSPPVAQKRTPQKIDESFHEAWKRYKDLLRAYPHHGFTELHQLDTFYHALNPADQDSLNAASGGNLLEKSPQDALTIIENKSKVRNSRSKPIASPVNACDNRSSSELAKLTHAVNQQISVVTTAMTAMLKQFQSNPPPAQVKAVEEIGVTYGGAHLYYQCLAADGNTFPEYRDNIQGYVSAATGNFNQGNLGYRPQGAANQMRPPGPTVPNPPKSVNPEEDECVEETYTDPDHVKYNIKVPPPPPQEKYDIQIQKFWNMFKQLHLNITLAEALVLMPKYQKMFNALLFNKEKLQELANTPLNENCSAVILKKLPEKHGDPGMFLIPCGFSLPDLIPTQMTLELANRAICTPDGIARDVFVLVGKFTFSADFVVVDYESDPRVPLILGRPFLRTAQHFEGIQKALTTEIKEIKAIFDELEAEVDQNVVNRKCDEIERKNLLIANDTLIENCLSKEGRNVL